MLMRTLKLNCIVLITTLTVLGGCESELGSLGVEATAESLHANYLNKCSSCHAPGAPGKTSQTEQKLDFTDAATMKTSLALKAAGLVGNQKGCNGVPFIEPGNASGSLLVAVLDEDVRQTFDNPKYPNCDGLSISPMDIRSVVAPSSIM